MNVLLVNYPKKIKHTHVAATLQVLIEDIYDRLKPGQPIDFDREEIEYKFKVTKQNNGNLVIKYREATNE